MDSTPRDETTVSSPSDRDTHPFYVEAEIDLAH